MMAPDWSTLYPSIAMISLGVGALLLDAFFPRGRDTRPALAILASAGLALTGLLLYPALRDAVHGEVPSRIVLGGAVVSDGLGAFAQVLVWTAAAVTILVAGPTLDRVGFPAGEFYSLLFLGSGGMMLLAVSHDLMMIFLNIEILSLAVYVLTALPRGSRGAAEGGMKYFVLGAFASAFLLYGMALIYGTTGRIDLPGVAGAAPHAALAHVGAGLLLVGLAFKIGVVPFHMWVPDAYEGAPAAVTGFMAAGIKAAATVPLVRILFTAFPGLSQGGVGLLWLLAAATLVFGNLAALAQTNLKRLLAYSSIAHTGYLLVGVVGAEGSRAGDGASSVAFYLLAYTVMTLGAFGALATLGKGGDLETLEACAGLAKRRPASAAVLTVFLVSLAGFPPTAGFFAKFYVFKAAVQRGYLGLTLIGVLGALVSAYYYLRPVVAMYMQEGKGEGGAQADRQELAPALGLGGMVLSVLMIGLFPSSWLELAQRVMRGML